MARSRKGDNKANSQEFNQNRLFRLLQLIRLLRSERELTMKDLAQILETGERSMYRYLRLLESVGFEVVRSREGFIRLEGQEIRDVFTEKEAALIQEAIRAVFPGEKMAESIARKLDVFGQINALAHPISQAGHAQILAKISEGIATGKRIVLKGYHSANSNTISHRIIEPIGFVGSHAFVAGLEVDSARNKFYRMDRISGVEVLEEPISMQHEHVERVPDVFGFALEPDAERKRIRLDMSLKAALFLKSEAPLAASKLVLDDTGKRMLLDAEVADYRPAVRFVLPFLGTQDLEVLGDDGFKAALERKGGAGQ